MKRARMAGEARRDFRDANSTWRSGVRPGPGHVIHRSSRLAGSVAPVAGCSIPGRPSFIPIFRFR